MPYGHVIVMVDPALADMGKLQRRMDRLADKMADGAVRAEVQPGCFGGPALKRMAGAVHAALIERQIRGWASTGPGRATTS